jgi:hypothetical protein
MKLHGALKGLICEIASLDSIVDAIKGRKVVVIYYDGDEPGGRGIRQIEPVCLGVSKAGNKVLRAWDSEGASHTGYKGEQPLPGWRLFRLDNFNGDKSMVSVILNAVFDNNPPPQEQPPQEQPPQTEEPPLNINPQTPEEEI